ncbi:MAG: UDP-N-acetylmuramyl-tripeptide synthetase [Candidatus Paceibacterota bacterium]|jgi:UDP-N-acetylmuramoyl-L-alanyl-D-glutamate--2,6-diaminopimelate ligase
MDTDESLNRFRKFIPEKLFRAGQPIYHYLLAVWGAARYKFPSRKIKVVAITGTKGKTTTAELVSAILEEAGYKTALASTLRFKIGKESERNMFKMTMPGRSFLQNFLRQAVEEKCDWAVVEMTSNGAQQFRHKFISLDALIFTNISPEHIESHGSYENYLAAKLAIAHSLEKSWKKNKVLVVNKDSQDSDKFLAINVPQKVAYNIGDAKPFTLKEDSSELNIFRERIVTKLAGEFNAYNILAAAMFAKSQGIAPDVIKRAIEKFQGVPGRLEKVVIDPSRFPEEVRAKFPAGRIEPPYTVIVDYAHTADSLEKLYKVFPNSHKICVLGSCGGGRDKWKRPQMGKIAAEYCDTIILTNEDPYDEDPQTIVEEIAKGMGRRKYRIIMDRREAIRAAIAEAKKNNVVLISGKGTDPYIMGTNGTKEPWSDYEVAQEEILRAMKLT